MSILLDTGRVKLMTSHMPLEALREVPGLENVRYDDPYAGTVGNSMRFAALSPRDDAMQVQGTSTTCSAAARRPGSSSGTPKPSSPARSAATTRCDSPRASRC